MKRLLWMALTISFAAPLAAADSWVSITGVSTGTDGGEGVRSLVPIKGGYALGGPTTAYSGNGQANFWLVLTDDLGSVTSQRSYYTGTEIFTNLNSVVATSDGGFVMAGQTGSGSDVLLAKVDSSGAVEWGWRYGIGGAFLANKLIATSDGGFAFAGQWKSSFALVKLDSAGAVTFASRFGGTGSAGTYNSAVDVIEVSDGYLLLGNQLDTVTQSDIRLLKTDKNGAFVWEKTYGGTSTDLPGSLAATGDGGYVFTGTTQSFGGTEVWVVRVDSTGAIVWQKEYVDTFSATRQCHGNKIIVTADGGFLVAGAIGTTEAGLYKLDSSGTLQWAKAFAQGSGYTYFADALQKPDGSFIAAGTANGGFFSPNDDFLVQVGPAGEFVGCVTAEFTPTAQVTTTDTTATATTITETGDSPIYTTSDPGMVEHDTDAPGSVCTSVLPPFLVPGTLATDAHGNGETISNVNGVADPSERVLVEPTWTNTGGTPLALTSTTPTAQDSVLDFEFDLTADYGTVGAGASADCFLATGDCLVAAVPTNDQRPTPHWDTHFDETLNGSWAFRWTIHIGGSFADVSLTDQFYKYIETLFHNGVTGGCGSGNYCPGNPVTRAQMAVFLLKGEHGGTYGPPTCGSTVFADVPCPGGTFVDWVNQLAAENITGGCGSGNYCPGNPVTRAQMAVFLLKAEHGGAYTPPVCSATVFADVVCPGAQFVDWINQLSSEGITGGCGGGNYCPGNSVTRGQMAVFLTRTFGLQLNAILP